MIASLPMYDWPEIRDATDAWWTGLARHLRAQGLRGVPRALVRGGPPEAAWTHPALLLSQTCGLPLARRLHRKLQVVATPCYAAEGCDGPTYSSLILVRDDSGIQSLEDLRGRVAAYNSTDSLSGHLALRLVLAPFGPLLAGTVETGSHAGSMAAVAEGRAEVCAIDCVTYGIAVRHRPSLTAGLRGIAWSPAMPALPYVTSASRTRSELLQIVKGLQIAAADMALAETRRTLMINGFVEPLPSAYDKVPRLDETLPALC